MSIVLTDAELLERVAVFISMGSYLVLEEDTMVSEIFEGGHYLFRYHNYVVHFLHCLLQLSSHPLLTPPFATSLSHHFSYTSRSLEQLKKCFKLLAFTVVEFGNDLVQLWQEVSPDLRPRKVVEEFQKASVMGCVSRRPPAVE